MAMVVVDVSSLQANSQPKSGGLVWVSAAVWRCSTFIKRTEWTLSMTFGHDDSTINIVLGLLLLLYAGVESPTPGKYSPGVSMPIHAERDIVMSNLSVCPSVCPPHFGIKTNVHIVRFFPPSCTAWLWFFECYRRYKIPMRTPSSGGVKYTRSCETLRFLTEAPFISETVRDRPMVAIDH